MTTYRYPIVGVPVTRAERYPHVIGPDADPDGNIATVEVTQLTMDTDHVVAGRVTVSAMGDPDDAWGFEFDLRARGCAGVGPAIAGGGSRGRVSGSSGTGRVSAQAPHSGSTSS